MAAVDIALWDLWGQATGLSVSELAGGRFADVLPAYVSGVRGADDAERRRDAPPSSSSRVCVASSCTSAPTSAPTSRPSTRSVPRTPTSSVALDAHWTYRLGEAKALGRELDDRRAWFFEAPLAPEDVEGHRDLAASIDTPVAVGEAMRSRFEFTDWLARRAVGLTQPDIGRTGITEGLAIAAVADAFHVQVAPHHSAAFGIAMAAGVHVAASSASLLAFEYQPFTLPVANRILTTPLEVRPDGGFLVPTGPGLGVTVDEDCRAGVRATLIGAKRAGHARCVRVMPRLLRDFAIRGCHCDSLLWARRRSAGPRGTPDGLTRADHRRRGIPCFRAPHTDAHRLRRERRPRRPRARVLAPAHPRR